MAVEIGLFRDVRPGQPLDEVEEQLFVLFKRSAGLPGVPTTQVRQRAGNRVAGPPDFEQALTFAVSTREFPKLREVFGGKTVLGLCVPIDDVSWTVSLDHPDGTSQAHVVSSDDLAGGWLQRQTAPIPVDALPPPPPLSDEPPPPDEPEPTPAPAKKATKKRRTKKKTTRRVSASPDDGAA